jgi:hypothetical protein
MKTALKNLNHLAFIAFFLFIPLFSYAQVGDDQPVKKELDPRVKVLLEELNWKYTVKDNGNTELVFKTDSNRTQAVYFGTRTHKLGDFEIRDIWSYALEMEGDLPQEVANELLAHNETVKLGAWSIFKSGGKTKVVFTVKVSANLTKAEQLKTAVNALFQTADEMEKKLEELSGETDKY